MSTTLKYLTKDGTLIVNEILDERLPSVTNGLVAHYPLDGLGGGIDIIAGAGTIQNIESRINIVDALNKSWKDPNNWSGGNVFWDEVEQAIRFDTPSTRTLNVMIPIQTNKHYYLAAEMKQGTSANGILYFGTISYDANLNMVAGHPGSYDYFVSVGGGLPTSWTKYNNNIIGGEYGNGRTGESSNTGDYATWHTGTKYTQILILNNYSGSSGPTYLKNLNFYTSDPNTSNVVPSYDGISVQHATSNLLPNQPNAVYGPWGGFTGSCKSFISPTGTTGITLHAITSGGCEWKNGLGNLPILPSTSYTISCRIKATNYSMVSANFFYIRQYNGGSQTSEIGKYNSSNLKDLQNGYYFTWATFTTDSTANLLTIQGYEYTGGQSISCYDLQLEKRAFPTAFVKGSVSDSSDLKIPIPTSINTFPFTVSVKVKNLLSGGQNAEGSEPHNCYPLSWWIVGGGYGGVLNQLPRSNVNVNVSEFRVTLILYATYWIAYYNNTIVFNQGYYANITPPFTLPISLGTRNGEEFLSRINAVYSNCSFYNRALTTDEIKKLNGVVSNNIDTTFSISTINENPVLPINSYYFPLSEDASDITKTINPVTSNNLAFEDSSVWLGSATTNVTNLALFGGSITVLGNKIYRFTGQQYLNIGISGMVPSSNCTTSWRLKGIVSSQTIRVSTESATSGNGYDLTNLTKYYKTYKKSIVCNASGYFSPLLYQFPGDNVNNLSDIYIDSVQVENKMFGSPYVNGSRGTGDLTYNFNTSIGLDWSDNWTISYWKKPVATYDDTMSNYNIESLGCNGNSVGGGYLWWGKDSGANSISTSSPSVFAPGDYFDKWHMVSLVRTGGTITIKEWSIGGQTHIRTASYSTTNKNYFVNQYGYDFKLSGWDNGNPTNSFYRDLVVAKYAITDNELGLIYNQSSLSPKGMCVKNLIEKGI